ncbi:MAG: HRDC domain-containing protein, partial [Alphaproteobacteria bacterium]
DYALADVTHLRPIYETLRDQLAKTGRAEWVAEEDAKLTHPATYEFDPDKAWQRLKVRRPTPEILAVLREVAAVREREAQNRDVPRNRILRDEALVEIAQSRPADARALDRIRAVPNGFGRSKLGEALLDAVVRGLAVPADERPRPPPPRGRDGAPGEVVELLKVLLRLLCEAEGVAQRLVASSDDLERIAAEGAAADVPAMGGWRRHLFGDKALALANGDVALAIGRQGLRLLELDGDDLQDTTPTARNVRPARRRKKGGGRTAAETESAADDALVGKG